MRELIRLKAIYEMLEEVTDRADGVANIIEAEAAACTDGARIKGVIVSLGGQTPLKLAAGLPDDLILGTPVSVFTIEKKIEDTSIIDINLL